MLLPTEPSHQPSNISSASQSLESPLLGFLSTPFLNWVVFLISSFLGSLYFLDIGPLSDVDLVNSPVCRLLLCLNDGVLCYAEASQSVRSHLSIIDFSACAHIELIQLF